MQQTEPKKTRPRNWSEYEDTELINKINDKKVKFLDIVKIHKRTPIAVVMRVIDHLKLMQEPDLIYGYDEYKKTPEYESDMTKLQKYRDKRNAPPVSTVNKHDELVQLYAEIELLKKANIELSARMSNIERYLMK